MSRSRGPESRTDSVWLKLLLVPLLLVGFATMHTLGHVADAGHGGGHHGSAAAAVEPATHTAAPGSEHVSETELPDFDPTEMCPVLGGSGPVSPCATTTVLLLGPQTPPQWLGQVRTFDPASVAVQNKPSLAALQILRV